MQTVLHGGGVRVLRRLGAAMLVTGIRADLA